MRWVSTRGKSPAISTSEVLKRGLAPDGGLYVPESFPEGVAPSDARIVRALRGLAKKSWASVAHDVIRPFFHGEKVESEVPSIVKSAFNFPIELRTLRSRRDRLGVLELFHGPTAAFKDAGARFLSHALARLQPPGHETTILVATSGDTGGAVASAFYERPGFRVVVLYPKGKVSSRQERQLTAWGDNVRTLSVRGDFDSCQKIVKELLSDEKWREEHGATSANSINVGRLLPQVTYYAWASLRYRTKHGAVPNWIIPTGNLGNAVAAFWAKKLGYPMGKIVIATNSNRTLPDYFESGLYEPRPAVQTLANAMDVGAPSNFERLEHLYGGREAFLQSSDSVASSVSDDEIRETIRETKVRWKETICPHTATAFKVWERIQSGEIDMGGVDEHWVVVSTAHPAKFETVVEPLIGEAVPIPESLQEILKRPPYVTEVAAELSAVKEAIGAPMKDVGSGF